MNWTDYIETNENVGFGKPVIKGTRLSVEFIVGLLANRTNPAELSKCRQRSP